MGQPAPDFTVTSFGGRTVTLADLKDDPIILDVWATWRAPRRQESPLSKAPIPAPEAEVKSRG